MPVPECGISLTTGELASEGVDTVLDAIGDVGATAIALPTTMMIRNTPTDEVRAPSPDAEDQGCMLDRPLWGERMPQVRQWPSHDPDPELWRGLPWSPPAAAPEDIRVDYPRLAIDGARERNLRVYAQLTPYALPSAQAGEGRSGIAEVRDEYRPQRLTGGPFSRSIAHIACLNHPQVRAVGRARVRELLRHYGDVDGLSIDWPEFPVLFIEETFTCFCEHCHTAAEQHGHDWDLICHGVRGLWDSYHTLTPDQIRAVTASGDWGDLLTDPATVQAGINAWLDYKAHMVALALQEIRDTMCDAGAGDLLLSANGFPAPWSGVTGADYGVAGKVVDSMRPKLYSFHWHMMIRWWTETLLLWNQESQITPDEMTAAVLAIFDITPTAANDVPVTAMFGMPGPDDHHGFTPGSYTDRLENALERRNDAAAPYIPLIHAYRSVDDFAELLDTIRPFAGDGLWVERYGYLRDEKLALLKQEWQSG